MSNLLFSLRMLALVAAAAATLGACSAPPPEPYGPVPTEAQVAWQRMEINMFCHFGPNTFSGAEWGTGLEAEDLFCPRALDCRQWVDVAAQAGMRGIILTAKHHDGFCLWPSAQSTHTVAQSSWLEGQGDVLRQLRTAVDEHNAAAGPAHGSPVQMGVYISPWDRNHPAYGSEEYNRVFANTLSEVHRQYGPLFEQWFDGACGEGPNGRRQEYDWELFESTVLDINPQCILFSDVGPGCRWVGNEEGRAGATCWSTLGIEGATPSANKPEPAVLEVGHSPLDSHCGPLSWVPAEVDVSLRPGWFWHPDEQPKTVDELMDIYCNSVGRNGLLLLNVPPDTNGRISAQDSAVLVAFRAERERLFGRDLAAGAQAHGHHRRGLRYAARQVLDTAYDTYWAAADTSASLTIILDSTTEFDLLVLQEYIPLGQRITCVDLLCDTEGDGRYDQRLDAVCTTVGYKRIVRLPSPVRCRSLMLSFSALAPPVVNRVSLHNSAR